MDIDGASLADRRLDDVWADDRAYLLGLATRMLGDRGDAEDVVQEAFGRLATVDLADLDDARGWMTVVVRRLCLDRLRSAHARRESPTDPVLADGVLSSPGTPSGGL